MITNRARVEDLAYQEIEDCLLGRFQTTHNLEFMQTLIRGFISATGIDLARQILDIDTATGSWLDEIAKFIGASRQDLAGLSQQNDDVFFRTYLKFILVRNFSKASIVNLASTLFILFKNTVYLSRQRTQPFLLVAYASSENFDILKVLIEKKLWKLPLSHSVKLIGAAPPEGYHWFSYLNIPFQDVIEGKIDLTTYLNLLDSDISKRQSYNNDGKTVWISSKNYIEFN
jgi:hypothetical protein